MRAGNPFLLFPWNRPFLPAIKAFIMEQTGGKPGSALIITPNKRPWRYLVDLFKQDKKALALPKMIPVKEMIALWRSWSSGIPKYNANILDQAGLLKECMHKLAKDDPDLASRFASMSIADFLPWGMRLQALLEELFLHGKNARDIPYAEDDVEPPAAQILASLGRIESAWRKILEERGWSTEGYDNYLALQYEDRIPDFLLPSPERPVFIAGFSTLNGVQDRLFHKLWEHGAMVCLHGAENIYDDPSMGAPCRPLLEWAHKWKAKIEPVQVAGEPPANGQPQYHFFAGYDSHSQLRQLRDDLPDYSTGKDSVAIVLPDESLLMPVLHELPDRHINISMGYPLNRSTLCGMAERLFRPRQYEREDGRLYWQEALNLLNLPFWGMLKPRTAYAGDPGFKNTLRSLEAEIRNGKPFVDLGALIEQFGTSLPDSHRDLLQKSYNAFIQAPAKIGTLAELADALDGILALILDYGSEIYQSFPVDAEAVARLQESIIPVLRYNGIASEPLPHKTLYGVLCELLNEERIAFEADPLSGMQILGMLETRLLNFDRVYIMDAADDALPGRKPQDPLLPDTLRPYLGLPDASFRHAISGYNLFRLCAGAKEVYFYWGEGSAPAAAGAGRKFRSRFVEQLIWKIESESKKGILKSGEEILRIAESSAAISRRKPVAILRDKGITEAVNKLQAGSASATLLNTYLNCPVQFIFSHIFQLRSPLQVQEGDNPLLTGECLHKTLEDFFRPYIGKPLTEIANKKDDLIKCWNDWYVKEGLPNSLPASSCLALELAAPVCLSRFMENFPVDTEIAALEQREYASLKLYKKTYSFSGRLDRIDRRVDGYHILDYKSGRPPEFDGTLWEDEEFFANLADYMDTHDVFDADADELLKALAERMDDVQLPLYMLIGEAKLGEIPANAEIAAIGDKGQEIPLLQPDADREKAMRNFRIAIEFILRHMAEIPEYKPADESGICENCGYARCCF